MKLLLSTVCFICIALCKAADDTSLTSPLPSTEPSKTTAQSTSPPPPANTTTSTASSTSTTTTSSSSSDRQTDSATPSTPNSTANVTDNITDTAKTTLSILDTTDNNTSTSAVTTASTASLSPNSTTTTTPSSSSTGTQISNLATSTQPSQTGPVTDHTTNGTSETNSSTTFVITTTSSSIAPSSSSQSQSTPSATPSTAPPTKPTTTTTIVPTTTPLTHHVKISETNILLVNGSQSIFVELLGNSNESLDGLFLTIRNASEKSNVESLPLTGELNAEGYFVVAKSQHLDSILPQALKSVVVALYSDELNAKKLTKDSLLDSLVLSMDSSRVEAEVAEVYNSQTGYDVYDGRSLQVSEEMSMSFCSGKKSSFVLTSATVGKQNDCDLSKLQPLQMKLTLPVGKNKCAFSHLPPGFTTSLADEIVSKINDEGHCGCTSFNVEDMLLRKKCTKDKKEIGVKFSIKSKFDEQIDCITQAYGGILKDQSITLEGEQYLLSNCSKLCFSKVEPNNDGQGKDLTTTIAVVVSCVVVFVVVVSVVVIYLRKKRRGSLQFRMTRLDEDDDELVGDMDDFVGNQGATFSNFR